MWDAEEDEGYGEVEEAEGSEYPGAIAVDAAACDGTEYQGRENQRYE